MHDAAYYRARAIQCLEVARSISDLNGVKEMSVMALHYLTRAAQIDAQGSITQSKQDGATSGDGV